MRLIVMRDNKGVTLIEVLIALTVLLIVFLGLIQGSLLSIQSNMRNILRDEGVRITSDTMTLLQSRTFNDMDNNGAVDPNPLNIPNFDDIYDTNAAMANVQRNIRSINDFTFTVNVNIQNIDANHKQITVTTTWVWQNENFQHQIMATRRG